MALNRVFPLVGRLPSTASAGLMPLFDGFLGTMRPSDFPQACMPDVRPKAFSGRPADLSVAGTRGISRFPCKDFPRMRRVFDYAGSTDGSPPAPSVVLPSAWVDGVGTPKEVISQLHGWPACAPVNASPSALRPPPHDSGPG